MTEHLILIWIRMGSIIFISVCVIFTLFFCVKRYVVGKKVTGDIVLKLKKPQDVVVKKLAAYGILIFMVSFRHSNNNLKYLIFVSFGAIIVCAVFDFLPQRLCENGILVRTGFIQWEMIKKVDDVTKMGTKVEVILKKQRYGSNRIVLYCLPGMSETVSTYISQKIQK
ncbi:hypothetical protein [Frisingicoccus sp.]|uniref:hypothetical protein n=1 Tax=Frisingicoccus sp. TaxID=1918627 RepID=UPI002E789384|nr:hypothetical protein [Frisingicoccus sp.]MEE0751626.1 hypothetical protein [Frisingicoccus sp.]